MRTSAAVWGSDHTSNCHHLRSILPAAKRALSRQG